MRYHTFYILIKRLSIPTSCLLLFSLFFYLLSILGIPLTHANNVIDDQFNAGSIFSSEEITSTLITDRVTPLLDWILDRSGQLTINQILSPEIQRTFSSFLFADFPKHEGTFWFRFVLDSTNRLSSSDLILDLNKRTPTQFPEPAQVWVVSMGSGKATLVNPISNNNYPLKYLGSEVLEVYIQLPGAPGVGFAPVLWTKKSFSTFYSSVHVVILFLLAITIVICLFRAFIEKQEWRIWAALYSGSIFISTLWGLPPTPRGILTIWDMPGLLAPCIALFILPHIGRRLMNTRKSSPSIDTQLLLLTLPGLILSILPLFPGYLWTLPYLSLWPLITILFLPTCLYARFCNLKQSTTFFTICIFPSIGMLPLTISTNSIPQYIPLGLLNLFPLMTLTLSAIFIMFVNSRKITSGAIRQEFSPSNVKKIPPIQSNQQRKTQGKKEEGQIVSGANLEIDILEQQLRAPLERIRNELSILNTSLQSTSLQQHVESIENTAETLSRIINDIPELFIANIQANKEIFDLNQIVLGIHEAVNNDAEAKNLAFSWFIAPHICQKYEGNPTQLTQVLYMLVESAIQATEKGLVQLRIQRAPNSTNPGELLITVSDSGKGSPPITRSPLALIHAWELATSTCGSVTMKSGSTGTTISFSICLTAKQTNMSLGRQQPEQFATNTQLATQLPQIIIADTTPSNRQLLTYYLDELPYTIFEAQDSVNLFNIYKQSPGSLIIFGPDVPTNMIIDSIGSIRVFEGEHNFLPTPIAAICNTEAQSEKLTRIGCTHILLEPLTRKNFRQTILQLSPIPQRLKTVVSPPLEFTPSKSFQDIPKQTLPVNSQLTDLVEDPQLSSIETILKDTNGAPSITYTDNHITEEYPHEKKGITLLKTPDQLKAKKNSITKEQSKFSSSLAHKQNGNILLSNKSISKIEQYPLMNTSEWVGEPTPIIKQKITSYVKKTSSTLTKDPSEWINEPTSIINQKKPSTATQLRTNSLYDSAEWVGEPTPIIKQKEKLFSQQLSIISSTENSEISIEEKQSSQQEKYIATIEKTESTINDQFANITVEKIQEDTTNLIITVEDTTNNNQLEDNVYPDDELTILQHPLEINESLPTYSSTLSVQNSSNELPLLSQKADSTNTPQPTKQSFKEIEQGSPLTSSPEVTKNSRKNNEDNNKGLELTPTTQKKYNNSRSKDSWRQKSSLSLLDMITIPTEEEQEISHLENPIYTDGYLSMNAPSNPGEEHIITLTEPIAAHNDTLAEGVGLPDLFNMYPSTETTTEGHTYSESQSNQLNMVQLFSSTLNLVEENSLLSPTKELFHELDVTLDLLQQAIQAKQPENLMSFSQVILSLSDQLKLKNLKILSSSLLDAIQTRKEDMVEQLIRDIKAEVQYNQNTMTNLL